MLLGIEKHLCTNVTVRYITRYVTVQYSTVQCSTVQCSTVQYSTVQYSTVRHGTARTSASPKLSWLESESTATPCISYSSIKS